MNEPTSAYTYIELGMNTWYLLNPQDANTDSYIQEIPRFISRLKLCNMPITTNIAKAIERVTIPCDTRTRRMTPTAWQQLKLTMNAIRQALEGEASGMKMIVLDSDGVSPLLRALPAVLSLTPVQLNLLQETILCIESGAYRAGVVMGWNLAYDYVRQWLFTNHLDDFNAYLTANNTYKSGASQFDPIKVYEDFFQKDAPSERIVLQSMNGAGLIGGEVYDHLCQYLRYRNNYAHPNFKALSRDQTNAFVEHLIGIIGESPFTKPVEPETSELTLHKEVP